MANYNILQPNDNFRGRSYGDWASEWWKWLVSADPDNHSEKDPVLFLRGEFSYEHVDGKKDGSRSPKSSRPHNDMTGNKGIEIYEGTAIFFPVIEAEFNEDDPDPDDGGILIKTEEEMRYLARRDIDEGGPMAASIKKGKGKSTPLVNDLRAYRAESSLFKLVVSDKNPFRDKMEVAQKAGTFDAVTDGYWILIKSLPPSKEPYQIHFEAKGRGDYYNAATYDITVKPKPSSIVEDKSRKMITGKSLY